MGLPWKNVWILGASSGIGRELARLVDDRGAHVAVSARSESALYDLASAGRSISAHPLDVVDAAAVVKCVADIETKTGPIDLGVNAAQRTIIDWIQADRSGIGCACRSG